MTDTTATAPVSATDEALEVLRGTCDGDDLSPRDLAILEAVVNAGNIDRLTDESKARWRTVVQSVRGGNYVQPAFQGIEHLTKDHDGYVKWRGKVVEHYSFDDAEAERAAAQRLALSCLRLEKDGLKPTSQNLFNLYDRMRRAAEMGPEVARYAVVWNTSADCVDLRVQVIGGTTDEEIAQDLAQQAVEADVGTSGRKTQQILITKEDYDQIAESIRSTVTWSRRMAWSSGELQPGHALYDEPAQALALLANLVDRGCLIDLARIEETYLGTRPLDQKEEESSQARAEEACR